MNPLSYSQTIDYLYSRLPLFSHIGADAYKPDLSNTIALAASLGNPQLRFKAIHIAGTNGKGSVSHILAAILQTAGYKTGLFTSPHLRNFRERIKINGEMIPESFVVSFTQKTRSQIENLQPSFFELTTTMAFEYFAHEKVDIAVIETGLGGRLDSTNIITPQVSVITSIGLDHTHILGNTVEKIAVEKAGIIKENIPVVVGAINEELKNIFITTANKKNAPVFFAADKREISEWKISEAQLHITVTNKEETIGYRLDLSGIYQLKNILTVLATCDVLQSIGWTISPAAIHHALKNVTGLTGLHGRWEVIHSKPMVVLDVAHNPDGILQILEQIKLVPHSRLYFILGMVKDKDVAAVLSLLPATAYYYFTQAAIPRAMAKEELYTMALEKGLTGEIVDNVNDGIATAVAQANEDDLIIACGSVFLIGEVADSAVQ